MPLAGFTRRRTGSRQSRPFTQLSFPRAKKRRCQAPKREMQFSSSLRYQRRVRPRETEFLPSVAADADTEASKAARQRLSAVLAELNPAGGKTDANAPGRKGGAKRL